MAKTFGIDDALEMLVSGLKQQAVKPNIFGYSPHAKQLIFHKLDKDGRLYIGGNRCLAAGTLVQMADGRVKPIEAIKAGEYVIAGDGTATKVLTTFDNGLKECHEYLIGRYQDVERVVCTPDHKFWSALEKHGTLKPFMKHPVGRLLDGRGRHKIQRSQGTDLGGYSEPRAYVLGLMLGDGYMAHHAPSQLQFTCADGYLADEVSAVFKQTNDPIQYKFREPKKWHDWFEQLGLIGTKSETKFIPDEVWAWDEESIRELLTGLIETDGSFFKTAQNEYHMTYCSNSRKMVEQFRHLMGIRMGVWGSSILFDSRGSYSVSYGTREALEILSAWDYRGIKAERAVTFSTQRNSYSSRVGVKSSTPVGLIQTYDIMVEHESHTYMLANGLITSNSGKSYGSVAEDIWWLTGTHPYLDTPEPPVRGRLVAVDFTQGVEQIIMPLFKILLPPSFLINGSWEESYSRQFRVLTLNNGSTLEFMSYEQETEKFAGTSRHFVHYDEEPPLHIFNECNARLVDTNGRWWISMTPVEGLTWTFDKIYEPIKEGTIPYYGMVEVDMLDNPHITKEASEKYLAGLDDDERKAREHGEYRQLGGLVYKKFSVETHVIEPWIPPKDWQWYCSLDHGYNNPTAVLWHAVSPDDHVVTFDEWYYNEKTIEEVAAAIHLKNEAHGKVPDFYVADPAIAQRSGISGTSVQTEYAKRGLFFALGNNDVSVGVAKVQMYLNIDAETGKPFYTITENCANYIKEMRKLRWKTWASKKFQYNNNAQETIHKKDDHACDSARYFFSFLPELAKARYKIESEPEMPPAEKRAGVNTYGSIDEVLAKMVKATPNTKWKNYHEGTDFSGFPSD